MFTYLATEIANWQDISEELAATDDMDSFLSYTRAILLRIIPDFPALNMVDSQLARNRFESVENLRNEVNIHFYGLMAAITLEETLTVLEDLRKLICVRKIVPISAKN